VTEKQKTVQCTLVIATKNSQLGKNAAKVVNAATSAILMDIRNGMASAAVSSRDN